MSTLIEQYDYNTAPGPWHCPESDLPAEPPAQHPVRMIAYYLPQFHAVPVNDYAWGKGFTEWSNLTKVLPRYAGHIQPRLPADLGFYDLSQKEALIAQAALAKRAGLWGFCIHDYWFSGEKVLETPLQILLDNPEIDLRFCLNWANENWTRTWDGAEKEIILEQKYGPDDPEAYIDSIAPALRDPRYIKVDGKPLLMLYRPASLADPEDTVKRWRAHARKIGIGELYLMSPYIYETSVPQEIGMDAVSGFPPHPHWNEGRDLRRDIQIFDRRFFARLRDYGDLAQMSMTDHPEGITYMPGVCPGWDNQARRPFSGYSYCNATPARYRAWLMAAARQAQQNDVPDGQIVFLNAWNEWAEGAILEPCRHYGHAWLVETRRALDAIADGSAPQDLVAQMPEDDRTPMKFRPVKRKRHLIRNRLNTLTKRIAKSYFGADIDLRGIGR